jgi:hypothetical protein
MALSSVVARAGDFNFLHVMQYDFNFMLLDHARSSFVARAGDAPYCIFGSPRPVLADAWSSRPTGGFAGSVRESRAKMPVAMVGGGDLVATPGWNSWGLTSWRVEGRRGAASAPGV